MHCDAAAYVQEKHDTCPWNADSRLQQIHPFAPLRIDHLQTDGGFPLELPLEPRDSLQLFDCLQLQLQDTITKNEADHAWTSAASDQLKLLSPEAFFADSPIQCISRAASRRYEAALKDLLCDWAKHGGETPGISAYRLL